MRSSAQLFWFLVRVGLGSPYGLQQLVPGAGDSGTNRTDRNAEDVGGLLVAQPGDLGQHECRSPIIVEFVQEFVDLHPVADRGEPISNVVRQRDHALLRAALSAAPTGRVGAGAARDREQPVAGRTAGPEPVERRQRPLVRLLGQILGVVAIAQVAAHRHDVGLRGGDEPFQRLLVAALGVEEERRQGIHAGTVCRGNQTVNRADRHIVDVHRGDESGIPCTDARLLVSAGTDDELTADEQRVLDDHLESCASCRDHADAVAALTRSFRLRSAQVEREFVSSVMSRSRPARLGRGGWLRPALVWCGLVIAALSLRPLVWADIDGTPTHIARHVGASSLALAVGLLYAAWRPHRAFGLLPLVGALLATTVLSTVLDTLDGARSPLSETGHLVETAGLVILWMVAGSPGWDRALGTVAVAQVASGSRSAHQLISASPVAPSSP